MPQGQSRTATRGQRTSRLPDKGRGRSRAKRSDLIQTREMVFSLSPLQMQNFLSLRMPHMDTLEVQLPPAVADDITVDPQLDQEADMEVRDEDDPQEQESPAESASLDYVAILGEAASFRETAVLQTNAIYAITITPDKGRYHCWFEAPNWFRRSMPQEYRVYVNKLEAFLQAIAHWLESDKQTFLHDPRPENYVQGEAPFHQNPVIQQKGLLARVNEKVVEAFPYKSKEKFEEAVHQKALDSTWAVWPELDESQFSRLLDKIWLLWPQWNMPLSALFSPAYHLPWLVEVVTPIYRAAGTQWHVATLNYPDFGDKDLAAIKGKSFTELTPEEALHVLRARIKGGRGMSASALRLICDKLA